MARPKKVIQAREANELAADQVEELEVVPVVEEVEVVPTTIALLSVDYTNEGLNNIARTLNELIKIHNASISGK